MAPLPQARGWFSAAALDNSVFVFGENNQFHLELISYKKYSLGGWKSSDTKSEIFLYKPLTNTWMEAGRMTTPRWGLSVALTEEVSDFCN